MKKQDNIAANIEFGIELETMIPVGCGVSVGGYHHGNPVITGIELATGNTISAPIFNGRSWRADNDGSIQSERGFMGCEFVSPVLKGEEGLIALRRMIEFITLIGGKVNKSCGCHITVGVRSVIGSLDSEQVSSYAKALANTAFKHAKAIYSQTGTDRHLNHYAHPLTSETPKHIAKMLRAQDVNVKQAATEACGRGMVNFRKLFSHGVVEFRAFAGTLNAAKVFHHLATVFAIVRRASELKNVGGFRKTVKEQNGQKTAPDSIRYFWKFAGWAAGSTREVALGLFGILHSEFKTYSPVAIEMAEKFEQRFPNVNL
jgi:hypothetical protein